MTYLFNTKSSREVRDTTNMQRVGHTRINRMFASIILEARQHQTEEQRREIINRQLSTHAATTTRP